MKILAFFPLFVLSSCGLYRSTFDCSVPSGMQCKSVTEIESMIVECEDGDDFLLSDQRRKHLHRCTMLPCSKQEETSPKFEGKVWVCSQHDPRRGYIEGHYVYINTSPSQVGPSAEESISESQGVLR